MAQVRNPWHLRALAAACEQVGVRIESGQRVAELRTSSNRIDGVVCEDGTIRSAERYLIASAAWSEQLLTQLGVRSGVHPVKGQIVLYRPVRQLISHIISVDKRYLVPRDDGRILVGSPEEPEAAFDKRPTRAGIGGLMQFAIGVVPQLDGELTEAGWAGLRPGSPDGLPFLGPVPGWTMRLSQPGITGGDPAIAWYGPIMTHLLSDGRRRCQLPTFDSIERPARLTLSGFGRSLCRQGRRSRQKALSERLFHSGHRARRRGGDRLSLAGLISSSRTPGGDTVSLATLAILATLLRGAFR